MLMENAAKHTKDVFIQFLRIFFNNPKNYAKKLPTQISDNRFIDIQFYDSEPEELRQFPTCIVTNAPGRMVTAGLGDMCSEVLDPRTGSIIAYRYQGFYEFSVNIDIGCRNPLEREVLTDFIAKALRFQLRRYIQNQGIIIKDVSYSGETTVDYNSDKLYISQLRIDTWSTWVEDVDLLDPNEFNISVEMEYNHDGQQHVVTKGMEKTEENGENPK